MSHYKQLIIIERENLMAGLYQGKSLRSIAKEMGRAASTLSRELERNNFGTTHRYSPSRAQTRYERQRQHCGRRRLLSDIKLRDITMPLFWIELWSPEQIANRIKHELKQHRISTVTIYRSIYAGFMDSDGRNATEFLRYRDIRRIRKEREKSKKAEGIKRIWDRPAYVSRRKIIGHWEGDTVEGKKGSDCLVTTVERASRFLLAGKVKGKDSRDVGQVIISMFSVLPKHHRRSLTVDRGGEFAQHREITSKLKKMPVYFCDPHSPWQRGTNENTNGLLRQYIPKGEDIAEWTDEEIRFIVDKLNRRPRKCLGWKTPYEVFYNKVLHLI